jgi:hypothetical protein
MEGAMTILRNIAGLVLGSIGGGFVNMAIITVGPSIIPPPPGVDVTDAKSIAASIHLFGPQHFVVPFVAHAVGTFAGAAGTWLISATNRTSLAFAVGATFFAGGVAISQMVPAPMWFVVVDLVGAYFPMTWLAVLVARRLAGETETGAATVAGDA